MQADKSRPTGESNRHSATRFNPWQRQPLDTFHTKGFAQENGVPVPAEADIIGSNIDHVEVGVFGNQTARNSGRTRTKPVIGLLQCDDIRAKLVDNIKYPTGVPCPVEAARLADIVARDAILPVCFSLCHKTHIGIEDAR